MEDPVVPESVWELKIERTTETGTSVYFSGIFAAKQTAHNVSCVLLGEEDVYWTGLPGMSLACVVPAGQCMMYLSLREVTVISTDDQIVRALDPYLIGESEDE